MFLVFSSIFGRWCFFFVDWLLYKQHQQQQQQRKNKRRWISRRSRNWIRANCAHYTIRWMESECKRNDNMCEKR